MKKTILIVDDEAEVVRLTADVLAKRGFNVLSVVSGEAALEAVARQKPDLIIIDYRLPGENGDVIVHRWKSAESTQKIPVLMCTAQALMKTPTGGNPRLLKPDDYLIKPFEIEQLLDKIRLLLRR
ncbi:MAG: response regulator [Candidatus Omnitrophota bacterium]